MIPKDAWDVILAMAKAYEETNGSLADRLMAALVAALALASLTTTATAANDTHCTTSDYAMQCHYGQPSSLLGVSPLTSPKVYAYGVDFAWSKPTVAWMHRAGAVFAAGYYSTDPSKNLTAGWVRAYHAAGIKTLAVWETTANRAAAARRIEVVLNFLSRVLRRGSEG